MTDEEHGRAWAEVMGRAPKQLINSRNGRAWHTAVEGFEDEPYLLPQHITLVMARSVYFSEAEAYAALGCALRKIGQ